MRFLKLNESFFFTQFQKDIISIHYKVFFERILPVKCLFHFVLLTTQNQRPVAEEGSQAHHKLVAKTHREIDEDHNLERAL